MEGIKKPQINLLTLLPILALAGAGISLIFTFLIGVSSTDGSANYYIYHFFDGNYISEISSLTLSWQTAGRAVWLVGMLLSIFGLIAVLIGTGLTVFKAILKYVYKQSADVEKTSLFTYFAYVIFSALFYAVNCVKASVEGVALHVGYNVATICGLTLASVIFGAYYLIKVLANVNYFKNRANIIKAVFALVRIVFMAVLIGLVTAPILKITTADSVTSVNFIQLISAGMTGTEEESLSWLTVSSVIGFVAVAVFSIYSTVFIAKNITVAFSKKNNDNVFYIISFVITLFLLFFAVVAVIFYKDIITSIITQLLNNDEISTATSAGGFRISFILKQDGVDVEQQFVSLSAGIPIAVCVISLVLVILNIAYPAISSIGEKKSVKTDAEGATFLEVKNLCKYFVVGSDFFGRPTKYLKAVDNVSFKLEKGKTLGIVGESGCGKTTMGRTLLRLYDVTKGEVIFKGQEVSALKNRDFDKLRPNMQMIFQDPYASLSPRLTVGEIIGEAVKQHKLVPKSEYQDYILSVMKMCGLQPHYFERYPHEFSGGQRQRICIARALALKPELVICDEPVSALDVSIQAQIINMLIELRKSLGLTYIFISHDLSVVKHISDEVGVMYLGSMVEYGGKEAIFNNTLHPYTKALFSAVPVPNPHVKMNRIILKGDIPSPVNPPSGCKFHTRCESCMGICSKIAPIYKEVEPGHFCACHLYNTKEEEKMLEEKYEEEQRLAQELEQNKEEKSVWKKLTGKVTSVFKSKSSADDEVDNASGE